MTGFAAWLRHRRRPLALAGALVIATTVLGVTLGTGSRSPPSAETFARLPHADGALPSLWSVPTFAFTDHRGEPVTSGSLRGRPYIADFIFTQCTSACPTLTAKMVLLQRRLAGVDVRFVSFSVDPGHDTREALAAYASRWNATELRWSLVPTDDESLRRLAAGFRVVAQPTRDPEMPILHSALFFLVDGAGTVRGVYPSTDDGALEALTTATRALTQPAANGTMASAGSLYLSLGCGGCHDDPRIAPPLVDLHGSRPLEGGGSVVVDDAYLRASILEPWRDRVAGYAATMPSYGGQLADTELDALVAELRARVSDAGAAATVAARVVVDPVCSMKVRAEPPGIHATVDGTEHWFCSEMCRDRFLEDPRKFGARR